MSFGFGVGDFIVVCDLVKKLRDRFVRAPAQATALHDHIVNLSNVVQAVGAASYTTSLNNEQVLRLDSISQGCQKILQQLNERLEDYQKADNIKGIGGQARRVFRRFDLDPSEVDQLRSQIIAHIGFFNTFLAELNREVSNATHKAVTQFNSHHENRLLLEEKAKILDWLTPTDYAAQQNDIFSVHQHGTGQWLLESAEFQHFMSEGGKTLFLRGMPGAGKTLLMSNVIHHLQQKLAFENNVCIAYLYCNFRRKEEQTALHICTNLLKQVSRARSTTPESVKSMHSRHVKVQSRPKLEEIVTTMCSVIKELTKCIFVIDALDELDFKNTRQLLPTLFEIQAHTGIQLIASSRENPEICNSFAACDSLQIRATEEDIGKFLEGRMFQLPNFVSKRLDLQDAVKTGITKASDGMFLLVTLHLDSLIGTRSPKALKRVLEKLPKGLNSLDRTYDKAMERIRSQLPEQYELAKQALAWITYAQRQLSTQQLRHVLAVEPGDTSLDEDNLPDADDIVSVCAGLVVTDEESGIVRLVHYTTQDYFERTKQTWFPNAEYNIAQTCNTYLSFTEFRAGPCKQEHYNKRLEQNPHFEYAALHWATHLNTVSAEFEPLVPDFIGDKRQVASIAQVRILHIPDFSIRFGGHNTYVLDKFAQNANDGYVDDCGNLQNALTQKEPVTNIQSDQITGLHLAAWSGARSIVEALLRIQRNPDAVDCRERTPLSWAAQAGHDDVVAYLLDQGADIDARDSDLRTPLIRATMHGNDSTVSLLLDRGAQFSTTDCGGDTALSHAVRAGTTSSVSALLSRGAVPNGIPSSLSRVPQPCRAPLSVAAERGHDEIVKILLARPDIVADFVDVSGRTALSHAAGAGHQTICALLLGREDVEAGSVDPWGRTPLSYAAENARHGVAKLLLGLCGGTEDLPDEYGRTPLSYAADADYLSRHTQSRLFTVQGILTNAQIDPNSQDIKGRTPLSYASSGWEGFANHDIARLLLADRRVDADSRDKSGRTPLSWSAGVRGHYRGVQYGGADVVKLLLMDERVDPNSKDSENRTPLAWALSTYRDEVSIPTIEALLSHEHIDPMQADEEGMTLLDHAVASQLEELIPILRPHYPLDYVLLDARRELISNCDDQKWDKDLSISF